MGEAAPLKLELAGGGPVVIIKKHPMAYYLVRACPKSKLSDELQSRLNRGEFEIMQPFGATLTRSLKDARWGLGDKPGRLGGRRLLLTPFGHGARGGLGPLLRGHTCGASIGGRRLEADFFSPFTMEVVRTFSRRELLHPTKS